ncbi:DUF6514 family protein [[Clostridium] colinum]|uniref:DUF6514 family protein n=1 Tax=[Clostridium] colinum TaxID=36835 RepID=UPI0020251E96|nr:DUF6514 family protein [[Clostridium] colinum]
MIIKTNSIIIKDDFNNDIKVEYNFIKTDIDENILYGFSIKAVNQNNNEKSYKEYLDFSKDLKYAEKIFNILIKNQVLPVNLINILDDFID